MKAFCIVKKIFYRLIKLTYVFLLYLKILIDDNIYNNVKPEICAKCGGECCKNCGCNYSPSDFKRLSFEYLKKEIEKGYISIDFFDRPMNRGIYFLRVRNINSPIVDMYSEKKRCILYTKYGCKFDYIHRPSGGKYLIPSNRFYTVNNHKVRACHLKYTIMDCCYEWEPYQKVLEELVQYFKEKDIQCSL